MPVSPTSYDIFIRLLLTLIAGALIGLNRETTGQAAGLRTTILLCLAASVAMIQTNILLSLGGKTPESFGVMDLMRMPLGILTGVGFIGAGCILKKGALITGMATAATLWTVTIIGLCFGGGQLLLGMITTALCLIVVGLLKKIDLMLPHKQHAILLVSPNKETLTPPDLNRLIQPLGYHASFLQWTNEVGAKTPKFQFIISWKKNSNTTALYDLLLLLEKDYLIESFKLGTQSIDCKY